MTKDEIDRGLKAIADSFAQQIRIVVLGSAALVLTKQISRDADDCDVGEVIPKSAESKLNDAGLKVAEKLSYTDNWLNMECRAWLSEFPRGWKKRVVQYRVFTNLVVNVMSRADCVSMLLLRMMYKDPTRDLADVAEIGLNVEEKALVLAYTRRMGKNFDMSRAQIALRLE